MKRAAVTLIVLAAVGGGGFAYYNYRNTRVAPTVTTARVTRGGIADAVGATGTLQAVTTVQVGTQVSGTISELHADFNSLVRKGQVLARLDPSLFETQIEQAQANLIRAHADLDRLRVTLDDAEIKHDRARELAKRQLIPQTELDAAEVAVRSTAAQIRSAEAQVTQAEASLNQSKVNLQHTVIVAPIDGLVISRDVDVGQTVAASMQAPTLFVLAADLTKMQVVADIDESDVGRIRPGQRVSFQVDAYPAEDFAGTVSQVRLQPQVVQNVVTYATVIDVPNGQLKLKPGMTANVSIEIAHRENVLRVPNAALRFRPTNDMYAALGQMPPGADAQVDRESVGLTHGGRRSGTTARSAGGDEESAERVAQSEQSVHAAPSSSGTGRIGRGDFSANMDRLQALPPEQRDAILERMRARGFDATIPVQHAEVPGSGGQTAQSLRAQNPEATTIDALFGPLPPVESTGRVWLYIGNELKPTRVRLGITDGQATELVQGDLQEGTELVTNVATGSDVARPTPQGGFPPFMPGGGRRFNRR